MKQNKKLSIAILSTLGLALGASSFTAQAIEAGDMFMRFTLTNVNPNDDSTEFNGPIPGLAPEVDDNTQLGLTFVYMYNDNVGFEVLAATPFKHDILVGGNVVAETKHLPPTVSAQYYFNPKTNLRPFVGIGLNYTTFFSDKSDPSLGGDLELDDSFGLAVQAGVDYDINEKWFLTADVRYISIETEATIAAVGSSDVDINPTVISIGAGFKF